LSCYIAQVGLEFRIFLPQSPKCWDFRHAPCSTTWLLFNGANLNCQVIQIFSLCFWLTILIVPLAKGSQKYPCHGLNAGLSFAFSLPQSLRA
jgi:hypothetical protein